MTAGAVLCGGGSRRMGTDKALIEIDGVPMAARVAAALDAAGCHPIVLVGADAAVSTLLARPRVIDRSPGAGPLGGVLTALAHCRDDTVVVACDLPNLTGATVIALVSAAAAAAAPAGPAAAPAAAADADVDVVVARTDRLEPAVAWWSARSLGALEDLWSRGTRAVHEAIAELRSVEVDVDPAELRNVNTPFDLTAGRRPGRGRGADQDR